MMKHTVSAPSRLCLFGEHQDYLGLEVIACAINLRFSAEVVPRNDGKIVITIRDKQIDTLGMENVEHLYEQVTIDLAQPIIYKNNRDYLNSSINILLKNGFELIGFDIKMDSNIPIGKGMCSSSTMIVVLLKALLEGIDHPDKDNAEKIAYLAFCAEVAEFNEPGGMMDHYTSALGGFVNLSFANGETLALNMEHEIEGSFILFDSKEQKNTTKVLADAKVPTLEALDALKVYGISSIKDFIVQDENLRFLQELDDKHRKVLLANIKNYEILIKAKALLKSGDANPVELGKLIYRHHQNLRDGLGISTPVIEKILDIAMENGALGGKINGSGGGGCCFVYAMNQDVDKIIQSVEKAGYPGQILKQDTGVRVDQIELI